MKKYNTRYVVEDGRKKIIEHVPISEERAIVQGLFKDYEIKMIKRLQPGASYVLYTGNCGLGYQVPNNPNYNDDSNHDNDD